MKDEFQPDASNCPRTLMLHLYKQQHSIINE